MDFATGLRSEIFRPIVTLVLPGIIAAAPFVVLAVQYYPRLWDFISTESATAVFLGFILAIGFGLISHDLGTNIERAWIDKILEKKDSEYMDDWYRYLRCTFDNSSPPVGQKYIHDLLLYLWFELNLAVALAIGWIGTLLLQFLSPVLSPSTFKIITAISVLVIAYLLWEAYNTGKILARVRKELLKGIAPPHLLDQSGP